MNKKSKSLIIISILFLFISLILIISVISKEVNISQNKTNESLRVVEPYSYEKSSSNNYDVSSKRILLKFRHFKPENRINNETINTLESLNKEKVYVLMQFDHIPSKEERRESNIISYNW